MFFTILMAFILNSMSRIYDNEINIFTFRRNGAWMFLDRINTPSSQLFINAKISLKTKQNPQNITFPIQLVLIKDNQWQSQLIQKCNNKAKQSHLSTQDSYIFQILLNPDNNFTNTLSTTIKTPTAQSYHIILRQCSQNILTVQFAAKTKLSVYFNITNDGNHESQSQNVYHYFLPFLILLNIIMIYFSRHRKNEKQTESWINYLLRITLILSLLSIVIKYIGFLFYAITGYEYQIFDYLYLLSHSSADTIIIILLVFLAFGWTINFNKSQDFQLYIVVSLVVGFMNVIVTLLNKINDGYHDVYHLYDTSSAYILIAIKILALLAFGIGIGISVSKAIKNKQNVLTQYFIKLTFIGFAYLMLLPFNFYVVELFPAGIREDAMFCLTEIIKNLLNLILLYVYLSKKSIYMRTQSQSFMQKGQKYY